jgi:hypothetical protein
VEAFLHELSGVEGGALQGFLEHVAKVVRLGGRLFGGNKVLAGDHGGRAEGVGNKAGIELAGVAPGTVPRGPLLLWQEERMGRADRSCGATRNGCPPFVKAMMF